MKINDLIIGTASNARVSCLKYFVFPLLAASLFGCANHYSAKEIQAWVIDAESHQPLSDVIVVAHWELSYGLEGGGAHQLVILETTTDSTGRFYFPAWGPKRVPQTLPSEARLKDLDPGLLFFKRDYENLALRNKKSIESMGWRGPSLRTSDWDGKKIPLKKFAATGERDAPLLHSLYFVEFGKNCEWKSLPRMIVALGQEQRRLKEKNIKFFGFDFTQIENLPSQGQCGSANEFFDGLRK